MGRGTEDGKGKEREGKGRDGGQEEGKSGREERIGKWDGGLDLGYLSRGPRVPSYTTECVCV